MNIMLWRFLGEYKKEDAEKNSVSYKRRNQVQKLKTLTLEALFAVLKLLGDLKEQIFPAGCLGNHLPNNAGFL